MAMKTCARCGRTLANRKFDMGIKPNLASWCRACVLTYLRSIRPNVYPTHTTSEGTPAQD